MDCPCSPPSSTASYIRTGQHARRSLLQIGDAAIDQQFRANDEAGFIGGEEHRCLGEFDWRTQTPDRYELPNFLAQCRLCFISQPQLTERGCLGRAGTEAVHPDATILELP